MAENNLFLLMPETNPTYQFIKSNEEIQFDEEAFGLHILSLNEIVNEIKIEKYNGFYDSENINNFLEHFKTIEEYYPAAPFILLRETLKTWENWRESVQQLSDTEYKIFGQQIEDNTFCEIAQRQTNSMECKHPVLNHKAFSENIELQVNVNNVNTVNIEHLSGSLKSKEWFSTNRIPSRTFHVIEKHPIKDSPPRMLNGKLASYLHCSEEKAQELLNTAIGLNIDELFAFDIDKNEIVVFKFENDNPQNMYHGYHVPVDSTEVPDNIKQKILNVE